MQIIGHRGARAMWPENTLAGFHRAIHAGVTAFELDVLPTRDEVLVVHHDARLQRDFTRNASGSWLTNQGDLIWNLTHIELCEYDVGRIRPFSIDALRFNEQEPIDGQKIPTLEDVLALVCDKAQVTIEVKTYPEESEWNIRSHIYVELLKRVIDNTPPWQDIIISSFDWNILSHVHNLIPGVPTAALTEESNNNELVHRVKALGAKIWSPEYHDVDTLLVDEAHSLGLKVIPYTVNDANHVKHMKKIGVDGIITDYPCKYGKSNET